MKNLKVGITGGIGSGKSYVAKIFKALGVPFYNADIRAKELMNTSAEIKNALVHAFGPDVYDRQGQLNRAHLASLVFNDTKKLEILNSIVHPVVIADGVRWSDEQSFNYSLKEAALLFESGSYKSLDFTILVTAPVELRIQRVIARDNVSKEQVSSRISAQMLDADKEKLADFTIVNDSHSPLLTQVIALHEYLLKKSQ